MTQLFRRSWKVTVDNLDVTPLDIEFRILRTIKHEPNKVALTLWNLNEDHRAKLLKRNSSNPGKKLVGIPVQIEAGYGDDTVVLFSGDLREVGSTLEGTDWKTVVAGDDGGRSYREGRINTQFNKGTPLGTVLKQCCDAMSIGTGNATDFTTQAELAGVGSTLPRTMACSGNAAEMLDRVVKSITVKDDNGNSVPVTWSIQNGALQLLRKGKPLNLKAIGLSPTSGLVGSPQASVDSSVSLGNPQQFAQGAKVKNAKAPKPVDPGILKFKTLLIPGLVPGRKVTLDSQSYKGGYYLTEVLYVGQSFGQAWHCECVARQYT